MQQIKLISKLEHKLKRADATELLASFQATYACWGLLHCRQIDVQWDQLRQDLLHRLKRDTRFLIPDGIGLNRCY